MKLHLLILLVAGLGASTYSVNADHISDPSLVAKGAKLYNDNCGRCHNPQPASDYSKQEWSVIMPHMREKAHMTGKEALAVEAFLASTLTADVRNNPQPLDTQGTPQTGEQLVAKFGCLGCHRLKGKGGTMAPELDGVIATKGEDFVIKKLKNPKFNNASSIMPQFPMTAQDMQKIIAYLSQN